MIIKELLIDEKLLHFLKTRGIKNQCDKCIHFLLHGNLQQVNLKIREPKHERIYYFRINKQYRGWGYMEGDIFHIFKIDNHQK